MDLIGKIVKFSPSALEEVHKLKEKESNPNKTNLRVGVKNGGCAGMSYVFEFDEMKEEDIVDKLDDIVSVIIDKTQAATILNLEVLYEKGLNNRGFIFKNPNANTTCGCGTSFS